MTNVHCDENVIHRKVCLAALSRDHLAVQGEFDLTLIQDGTLAAAFMGGLTVAAIIFAELSQRFNAMRLMGEPNDYTWSELPLVRLLDSNPQEAHDDVQICH